MREAIEAKEALGVALQEAIEWRQSLQSTLCQSLQKTTSHLEHHSALLQFDRKLLKEHTIKQAHVKLQEMETLVADGHAWKALKHFKRQLQPLIPYIQDTKLQADILDSFEKIKANAEKLVKAQIHEWLAASKQSTIGPQRLHLHANASSIGNTKKSFIRDPSLKLDQFLQIRLLYLECHSNNDENVDGKSSSSMFLTWIEKERAEMLSRLLQPMFKADDAGIRDSFSAYLGSLGTHLAVSEAILALPPIKIINSKVQSSNFLISECDAVHAALTFFITDALHRCTLATSLATLQSSLRGFCKAFGLKPLEDGMEALSIAHKHLCQRDLQDRLKVLVLAGDFSGINTLLQTDEDLLGEKNSEFSLTKLILGSVRTEEDVGKVTRHLSKLPQEESDAIRPLLLEKLHLEGIFPTHSLIKDNGLLYSSEAVERMSQALQHVQGDPGMLELARKRVFSILKDKTIPKQTNAAVKITDLQLGRMRTDAESLSKVIGPLPEWTQMLALCASSNPQCILDPLVRTQKYKDVHLPTLKAFLPLLKVQDEKRQQALDDLALLL